MTQCARIGCPNEADSQNKKYCSPECAPFAWLCARQKKSPIIPRVKKEYVPKPKVPKRQMMTDTERSKAIAAAVAEQKRINLGIRKRD